MFTHLASVRRASLIAAVILLVSAVTMRAGVWGSGNRAETGAPHGDRPRTLPAQRETGKLINLGDLLFETGERTITLLEPNGGESWGFGETHRVEWESVGLVENVKITLWDEGGNQIGVIATNLPPTATQYDWRVGFFYDGTWTGDAAPYYIRIREMGQPVADNSDAPFDVTPGIVVLSPDGGESWVKAGSEQIAWAACGLLHDVKLNLYDDGDRVGAIVSSAPGEEFDWIVGRLEDGSFVEPGSAYRIVVKENDVNRYDASDGDFAIEPGGSPQRLFAMSTADETVYVGWRDSGAHGYNVYRLEEGVDDDYVLVTPAPITASTNWVDADVVIGRAYRYRVSETDASGVERASSISVRCDCIARDESNEYTCMKIVDETIPDLKEALPMSGDVDGDGLSDIMVRTMNAAATEGRVRVYLDDPAGGTLGADDMIHERVLSCVEPQATFICWTLWDMNGDGREDLVGIDYDGGFNARIVDLANGTTTGPVAVPGEGLTTRYKSIAIANLRGNGPCLIYRAGTRWNQNKWIVALSNDLEMIGQEEIPASADNSTPAFAHFIEVADIDADGRDEGILGSWIIECDGDGAFAPYAKWGYEHPDGIWVADVISDAGHPGQEIYMYVEHPGMTFLYRSFESGAFSGAEIWHQKNTHDKDPDPWDYHADRGWVANVVSECDGMEAYTLYKDYTRTMVDTDGDGKEDTCVKTCYLAEGQLNSFLLNSSSSTNPPNAIRHYDDFRHGPIDWNGIEDGETVEIIEGVAGGKIVKLSADGSSFSSVASGFSAGGKLVMDVVGDYREELVTAYADPTTGVLTVTIYTNTDHTPSRAPSPCESRQYMQKRRWAGH